MARRLRAGKSGAIRIVPSLWLLLVTLLIVACVWILCGLPPVSPSFRHAITSPTRPQTTVTAHPISLSPLATANNRVWIRPKSLELSTDGLLVDSARPRNRTGSFGYTSDSCPALTCSVHFASVTDHSDFLLLSKKGDKSSYDAWGMSPTLPNQDQSVLIHSTYSRHKLVALLDGHGELGHVASEAVVLDLPFRLWDQLEAVSAARATTSRIESIFQQAFVDVDRGIVSQVPEAGTTAVILYQNDDTVYLASAGDSTVFCATYDNSQSKIGNTSIILQAVQHKPANPLERARIEAHGGTVTIPGPYDAGASSRVMIPGPDGMTTALAMSRCLGDEEGKAAEVLIAEPSVISMAIRTKMFCVAASDGLIDFVPVTTVADIIGEALYGSGQPNLAVVSQRLIDSSVRQWFQATGGTYRDDISLVVTRIS